MAGGLHNPNSMPILYSLLIHQALHIIIAREEQHQLREKNDPLENGVACKGKNTLKFLAKGLNHLEIGHL